MKHLPYAIAPLALAISSFALAADAEKTPTEIVITADRSLAPVTERLDAATVITRQDIERQQAASVADLIAQSTGISLPSTGGALSSTGVFLRGFKSNQVLVLIDGVRANDASSGQFDFSVIRPEDVERIEVVRGGYSSQYGSDAMGGIIQIFTRKKAENAISLRAGSFKTREETLTLGARGAQGGANLSYSQLDTAGFNTANQHYTDANGGCFPPFFCPTANANKDGGDQRTLRLAADRQLNADTRVTTQAMVKDGHTDVKNGASAQNFSQVGINLDQRVTTNYQYQVAVGFLRNKQTSDADFGSGFTSEMYDTQRYNLDWINTIQSQTLGTTTAGVNLADVKTYVTTAYSNIAQHLGSNGLFLINEKRIGALSYRLSGRHDYYEAWGSHDTGSIRVGYQLTPNLDAFAGYGTNFRAPTVNELYGFGGNTNLQPETSRQKDVGLAWRPSAQHQLKLTGYQADVQDLIAGFPVQNVNHARLKGIEVEANGQLGNTGYQLGLLRAQVDSDQAGRQRRPRAQLTGDIHHRLAAPVVVGVQLLSRSNQPDYDVNPSNGLVKGFAVFNAYATWAATPKLQLGLRLDNLTDKVYETVRGYSTPARSAYVTLRYRF